MTCACGHPRHDGDCTGRVRMDGADLPCPCPGDAPVLSDRGKNWNHSPVRAIRDRSAGDLALVDQVLLGADGRLRPVTSREVDAIDRELLDLWLHKRAIYGPPTVELLTFLMAYVAGRPCIEIGAGAGVFGRMLGWKMTDSYVQLRADVVAMYELSGQPRVQYGPDVEMLEACEAVRKYKPRVVFGSWVTQLYKSGDKNGSMYGVDEEWLLEHVEAYIVFGSMRIHGDKRIRSRPHLVIQEPWMRSRSHDGNALFIWEKGK